MIVISHEGKKYAFIEKKGVWVDSNNSIVDHFDLENALRNSAANLGHSLPEVAIKSPNMISSIQKESSQEDQVVDKPIRKGKKSTGVSLKNLMKNNQE